MSTARKRPSPKLTAAAPPRARSAANAVAAPAARQMLSVEVTLDGITPPIRRKIVVPDDLTFAQLHRVIQAAFAWEDCHLHQFEVGDRNIGTPEPGGFERDQELEDERVVRLAEALRATEVSLLVRFWRRLVARHCDRGATAGRRQERASACRSKGRPTRGLRRSLRLCGALRSSRGSDSSGARRDARMGRELRSRAIRTRQSSARGCALFVRRAVRTKRRACPSWRRARPCCRVRREMVRMSPRPGAPESDHRSRPHRAVHRAALRRTLPRCRAPAARLT